MEVLPKEMLAFLRRHRVLTLATSVDEEAWCANLFYAFLPEEGCFIFSSDMETKHARDLSRNCYVAGSVVLESRVVGRLQGMQFQGVAMPVREEMRERAERAYLRRFPVASVMQLNLWHLAVAIFKYTDNTLGFGKKLYWYRDQMSSTLHLISQSKEA